MISKHHEFVKLCDDLFGLSMRVRNHFNLEEEKFN